MRNFFSGYTITGTWAEHIARGSLGGIDRAMGMGTALPACAAGVVTYIAYNGTGGHTATIRHDDGQKTQYMHLSRFALANGTRVNEGDIVGYSGGCSGCDGAGSSTGPHLHAHSINTAGVRIPPLYEGSTSAGSGSGTDWMGGGSVAAWVEIQKWLTSIGLYSGQIDGDPQTITWKGLQAYLASAWGYTGAIDGLPGSLSWSAMQRWLAAGYGYTGVIDGIPGPLTAAAIDRLGALINAPVVTPNTRKVLGPLTAVRRVSATTKSASVEPDFAVDAVVTVAGWVYGETVEGNKVWFKVGNEFSWSGNFTDVTTGSLTDLNDTTTPPPVPTYPTIPYAFTIDFPTITSRAVPADWSNFENEYSTPNPADRKGFPAKPLKVVVHQWGNPGAYSMSSVLNTMKARHEEASQVSSHFVIDAAEIVQVVSLADRAYHAGAGGNDFVGLECDPLMTEAVIVNIRTVLKELATKYGSILVIVLHRDVPGASTSCGTWIAPHLEELDITKPYPATTPPPTDPDLAQEVADLTVRVTALEKQVGVLTSASKAAGSALTNV